MKEKEGIIAFFTTILIPIAFFFEGKNITITYGLLILSVLINLAFIIYAIMRKRK